MESRSRLNRIVVDRSSLYHVGQWQRRKAHQLGDGRYATPVWSPRGDLIAFTKQQGGRFCDGVMRFRWNRRTPADREAHHVEGPTWAPNGRVLMYFKDLPSSAGGRNKTAKLYSIDLTGYNEREVPTPMDA